MIYIVDYSDNDKHIYRLGQTNDLTKRKTIYDTHTAFKKNIVFTKVVACPLQYEICLKSMLYKYRIKNRKDFYECPLNKIRKAFNKCDDSIKCMNQIGGDYTDTNMINFYIDELSTRLGKIEAEIKKYNALLNS